MQILTLNTVDLDSGWAFYKVLATIVHPENAHAREELLAVCWARCLRRFQEVYKETFNKIFNDVLKEESTEALQDVCKVVDELATHAFFSLPLCDPAGAIQLLRHAPAEEKVFARIQRAFSRGYVVGRILQLMIQMQMTDEAPSVEKAIFVMEHLLTAARTQAGEKVPHSRKEIHKAWRELKSVAHFWAAYYIQYPHDQVNDLCTAGVPAYTLKGICSTGIPPRETPARERSTTNLFSGKLPLLLTFLATAEWFRHWGSDHAPRHHHTPRPWLDPRTTWQCAVSGVAPERLPEVDVKLSPLPDDLRARLVRYKANHRF